MHTEAAIASDEIISPELLATLLYEQHVSVRPALHRLWDYYRNELDYSEGDEFRPYSAAQQQGLPDRLARSPRQATRLADVGGGRREVVIENDIAWRVHTLVDFMFGKAPVFQSLAPDPRKAKLIESAIRAAFEANGGICLFQDMALLGGVYGFVDVLLRADRMPAPFTPGPRTLRLTDGSSTGIAITDPAPSNNHDAERVTRFASKLLLETVEAPRAIPVLDPSDYRRLVGYVLHYTRVLNRVENQSILASLIDGRGRGKPGRQATVEVTEVWTAERITIHHDGALVSESVNRLGVLPVVHVQNLPQPFFYEGLSEVEPLIPLQDELNTRLSDRANRVTMQSFKMYLGKGIENFTERPIGPGQMWQTDNDRASIESFGGDSANPSEDAHIAEIRSAMDKASGVSPIAAGVIRGKVGNLTSEAALRIVLMGLLARTEKKRTAYGMGLEKLCELVLRALDVAGVLRTTEEERRVEIHWPSPIPENQTERLRDALLKLKVGVPRDQVLAELGYGDPEEQ